MRAESSLDRRIAKRSIAVVNEQLIRRWLVHLGMAVVAVPVALAHGLVIEIPLQIIDDEEIERPSLFTSTQAPATAHNGPYSASGLFRFAFAVTSVNVPSPLLW